MLLHTGSINQRAQRTHGAALFADHFAHVRLGHPDFDARHSIALDLTNVDGVRVINQGLDNHFDGFAHEQSTELSKNTEASQSNLALGSLGLRFNRRSFQLCCLLDQLTHRISWLSTLLDPVLNAFSLKIDLCRLTRRIVSTQIFEVRPVALRLLFLNYDAI